MLATGAMSRMKLKLRFVYSVALTVYIAVRDDAVEVQNIGNHCIDLVVGQ